MLQHSAVALPHAESGKGYLLKQGKEKMAYQNHSETCTPSTHRKPKGVGLVAPAGNG